MKPIAVQLYSLRDELGRDFNGTLQRVADMGFVGVEFAGMYGESASSAKQLCDHLGLQISSAHMGLPIGDNRDAVLKASEALGTNLIVCPWMPPDRFQSLDSIRQVCDEINAGADVAKQAGLKLGYHNHDFEFRHLEDGSLVFDHMLSLINPEVFFEIDIYWVTYAGVKPSEVIKGLGERAKLLHIKDGDGKPNSPMLPQGEGIVDTFGAVEASDGHADWLIVELDSCATDMFEAVLTGKNYLVNKGLGHGR